MNIFYLHHNPTEAAKMHCDQHVRKMLIESAQMLSTAHRVLDGSATSISSRKKPIRLLPGETVLQGADGKLDLQNKICCLETHANHGSSIWARSSLSQYFWLFDLYKNLNDEFRFRFGRDHLCWLNWNRFLKNAPLSLNEDSYDEPPQMMPDEYKSPSTIEAYREFYRREKSKFATWSKRETPNWYNT